MNSKPHLTGSEPAQSGSDVPAAPPAPITARVDAAARVDVALTTHGLASSRTRAAREIAAGKVTLNGQAVDRPSVPVSAGDELAISQPEVWVARSAHKLVGALHDLGVRSLAGLVCLDAGASTGGFSQVLLSLGARLVYAVDVGHGQLHPLVAEQERLVEISHTNVRTLDSAGLAQATPPGAGLDGRVDLVVADLSFISLPLVIPALTRTLRDSAHLLLLIKPQFELGRTGTNAHGIVREPAARVRAVNGVLAELRQHGCTPLTLMASTLPGEHGNVEAFVWARSAPGSGLAPASEISTTVRQDTTLDLHAHATGVTTGADLSVRMTRLLSTHTPGR